MTALLFYEQINLALLLGSAGLILLICLLPLSAKRYLKADGVVYELPPVAPIFPSQPPILFDKLLTVFYIAASTLLFALSFFLPAETASHTPSLVDVWLDTFFPFVIYFPLMARYTTVFAPLDRLRPDYVLLVLAGLLCIYFLNFFIELTGFYKWIIHVTGSPETQQAIQMLKNAPAAHVIPMAVSAVVVAPIVEEFFFRGFIFRLLSCRIGITAAAVLSGLYFGAVHLSLVQTVTLTIFGVVQCFLYAKTRSILYPILLHAIFNAIAVTQIYSMLQH